MKSSELTVTQSSLHMFLTCRQKYEYRYLKNIVPVKTFESLVFGSAIHKGLEAWFKYGIAQNAIDATHSELLSDEDQLKARGMIQAYIDVYSPEDFDVVEIEKSFSITVKSPVTKRLAKGITFSGKVDGLVEKDGDLWLLEHKSTGQTPNDNYWLSKEFDDQIYLYAYALENILQRRIKGCIYDVLVKPQFKMSIGETDEQFEARKAESKQPSKIKRKEGETHEQFQERVCEAMKDGIKLRRDWIEFDRERLKEKWQTLYIVSKEMKGFYTYQNSSACNMYGGCEYCKLCKEKGNVDACGDIYTTRAPHKELEVEDGSEQKS